MNNFIPVGAQCFNATALKSLNLRTESLPFDYVRIRLNHVFNITKDLKENENCLDAYLDNFLETYLTTNNYGYNKLEIFVGHFVDNKGVEPDPAKGKIFDIRADDETFTKFKRRFIRYLDRFYNRTNYLICNDIGHKDKDKRISQICENAQNLLDLNKTNKMLIFTYKNRTDYDELQSERLTVLKIDMESQNPSFHDARIMMRDVLKKMFL